MPKSSAVTLYDDRGYSLLATKTSVVAAGAGTTVAKNGPGRLVKAIYTTAGTSTDNVTIYDNASAASGTVLAVIPGAGTIGSSVSIDLPALNGITAAGVSGSAALVLGFS